MHGAGYQLEKADALELIKDYILDATRHFYWAIKEVGILGDRLLKPCLTVLVNDVEIVVRRGPCWL
jgi:hypothetical protein